MAAYGTRWALAVALYGGPQRFHALLAATLAVGSRHRPVPRTEATLPPEASVRTRAALLGGTAAARSILVSFGPHASPPSPGGGSLARILSGAAPGLVLLRGQYRCVARCAGDALSERRTGGRADRGEPGPARGGDCTSSSFPDAPAFLPEPRRNSRRSPTIAAAVPRAAPSRSAIPNTAGSADWIAESERTLDLRRGKKLRVESEIDAQVVVGLVLESGAEAGNRNRRRPHLPVVLVLPQIPGGIDLHAAIRLHEIPRRGDHVQNLRARIEGALQQRRLGVVQRIHAHGWTAVGPVSRMEMSPAASPNAAAYWNPRIPVPSRKDINDRSFHFDCIAACAIIGTSDNRPDPDQPPGRKKARRERKVPALDQIPQLRGAPVPRRREGGPRRHQLPRVRRVLPRDRSRDLRKRRRQPGEEPGNFAQAVHGAVHRTRETKAS